MKKSVFYSLRFAAMGFAAFIICSLSTGAYAQFQQDDYSAGIDKGIVKHHFELGAGKENFEWS